ncbi:MAG: hypothetical protein MZV65_48570 [Chromatiales bacterium]|nr:hypothetical protein [Chromatiales bacterium]
MIAACSRRAKTEAFNFTDVAHVARQPARRRDLDRARQRRRTRKPRQEMADDYVRMGCAEVKKMKLPGGQPEPRRQQAHPGGRRRHLRHDRGARGRPRPATTWCWSRRPARSAAGPASCGSACRTASPTPSPMDTGVAGADRRRSTADQRIKVLPELDHRRDRRRARPLQRRHRAPSRGATATEERRRHHPGHRLHHLRHQQAARTGRRQEPERGRPGRPRSAGQGGQRRRRSSARPTASEVKSVVFVQCAGQRDRQRQAPALLLRPLLQHQHQAGDVLQGQPTRTIDTVVMFTDLRTPGMRRGLLPQRARTRA